MVYLSAECTGGGVSRLDYQGLHSVRADVTMLSQTNFPRLQMPHDRKWCQFLECNEEIADSDGVTFKPRKGSAVFWTNFDADGRGYQETIHAGLPVLSGTKIGLNIWSWYQAGHVAPDE